MKEGKNNYKRKVCSSPISLNNQFRKNLKKYIKIFFKKNNINKLDPFADSIRNFSANLIAKKAENELKRINSSKLFCPNVPINQISLRYKFGKEWQFKYFEELNQYNKLKDIHQNEIKFNSKKIYDSEQKKMLSIQNINSTQFGKASRSQSALKIRKFEMPFSEHSSMKLVRTIIKNEKEKEFIELINNNKVKATQIDLNLKTISQTSKTKLLKIQPKKFPLQTSLSSNLKISKIGHHNTNSEYKSNPYLSDNFSLTNNESKIFLDSLKKVIHSNII